MGSRPSVVGWWTHSDGGWRQHCVGYYGAFWGQSVTGSTNIRGSGESQANAAASTPRLTMITIPGRSPYAVERAPATTAPSDQPTPKDRTRPAVLTLPWSASGVTCWR